MTATYIATGDRIDYTPSSAVAAGDVVVVGEVVGIATEDIAASAKGSLVVEGVVKLPKATTSVSALNQGTKVWWNASSQIVTTTASSHKVAGYVETAATATASTVRVKLARA